MKGVVLTTAALLLALAVACTGGDGEARVSRADIAATLEGFVTALAAGDAEGLTTYWSETCSEEDIAQSAVGSGLNKGQLGGEYELSVDADALVFEVVDEAHVTLPLDQPDGVFVATVEGEPRDDTRFSLIGDSEPLSLAREDGAWKVASCDMFASEDTPADEERE